MGLGTVCAFPRRRLDSFKVVLERACDHLQMFPRIQDPWRAPKSFHTLVSTLSTLLDLLKKNLLKSVNHWVSLPRYPLAGDQ